MPAFMRNHRGIRGIHARTAGLEVVRRAAVVVRVAGLREVHIRGHDKVRGGVIRQHRTHPIAQEIDMVEGVALRRDERRRSRIHRQRRAAVRWHGLRERVLRTRVVEHIVERTAEVDGHRGGAAQSRKAERTVQIRSGGQARGAHAQVAHGRRNLRVGSAVRCETRSHKRAYRSAYVEVMDRFGAPQQHAAFGIDRQTPTCRFGLGRFVVGFQVPREARLRDQRQADCIQGRTPDQARCGHACRHATGLRAEARARDLLGLRRADGR